MAKSYFLQNWRLMWKMIAVMLMNPTIVLQMARKDVISSTIPFNGSGSKIPIPGDIIYIWSWKDDSGEHTKIKISKTCRNNMLNFRKRSK